MQRGEHMDITRMALHRRDYLWYQGPISGKRGEVQSAATGIIHRWNHVPDGSVSVNLTWIRWRHDIITTPESRPQTAMQHMTLLLIPDASHGPSDAIEQPWRVEMR